MSEVRVTVEKYADGEVYKATRTLSQNQLDNVWFEPEKAVADAAAFAYREIEKTIDQKLEQA